MSTQKVIINKKCKTQTSADLEKLDKEDLIERIIRLQAHNNQLRNILNKKLSQQEKQDVEIKTIFKNHNELNETLDLSNVDMDTLNIKDAKPSKKRKFEFSNCHKRHVLLKFLYFGWNYHGFAVQEDTNDTIENHVFNALIRACLIESRATSNYHRCGRTDKEVSAFSQVISIDLRSKFPEAEQLTPEALKQEIEYCDLLNRILPKNIKCIAWMPLRTTFYSARFDCISRTYRYYFPKGNLNIEKMQEACALLKCHADFRNFCKLDVHNGVTNYMRNIQSANIEICPNEPSDSLGYRMHYLEIKANAFLWHQIRCIMSVLLLVGQDKEEPNIINELLDVEKNPCRPQYGPASGIPLNLFDCEYRKLTTRKDDSIVEHDLDDTTSWIYNEENLSKLIETVQSEWTLVSVKTAMIRNVLHSLESLFNAQFHPTHNIQSQCHALEETFKPRQYQKLLERKRCQSLEDRIDHFVKKQRIVLGTANEKVNSTTQSNEAGED